MDIRIALAGNPNCGKTTLFNALTGARQRVGNWPGVTVEKKEGTYKGDKSVIITDLPGVYSLSPFSPEEIVTRTYLCDDNPQVVINLVDSTNLERNLYLTTQIIELGVPVVVAVNMIDLMRKKGDDINLEKLSRRLGCPCIAVSALKQEGISELIKTAVEVAKNGKKPESTLHFTNDAQQPIEAISSIIADKVPAESLRFYAIKCLEGEDRTFEKFSISKEDRARIDSIRQSYEQNVDDDAESAITCERYDMISDVVDECHKRSFKGTTLTEKVDRVVTSRIFGLPIFVAVMFLVYYIAISTIGTGATDWVNDKLFDEGWLITNTEQYEEDKGDYEDAQDQIKHYIEAAEEAGVETDDVKEALEEEDKSDEDKATIEEFADSLKDKNIAITYDKKDDDTKEVSQVSVDYDAFREALDVEEPDPAEYGLFMPSVPSVVGDWLDDIDAAEWVKGLVLDGVIAGVGAVLGFLPQMAVLFLELALLEGCGYMARIAFLMDRLFRRFGLSGKSFIPILIATGCGVPGVMSTKTIEDERDRRLTIMTTTMIPCSAKTPIIALIFGSIAGGDAATTAWVAPLFYFLGIFAIVISAIMLRKTRFFAGEATPFVMELPPYHVPSARNVGMSVLDRCKAFVIKAGTVIFISAIVVWFLLNFGMYDGSFGLLDSKMDDYMQYSIMAVIGNAFAWIFTPLGFSDWQTVVTTITGLVAKENVVSTVGIITSVGSEASESDPDLWTSFAGLFNGNVGAMISFCAFNLLCAPCFAAIGAIRNQMASAKWFWAAIGFMCGFAWVVGFIIYQIFSAVTGSIQPIGLAIAFIFLALIVFQVVRPMPKRSGASAGERSAATSVPLASE